MLDRGFLCGAIVVILVWLLAPDFSNLSLFSSNLAKCVPHVVGYTSIGVLFIAGELDRKDQEAPFGKKRLGFLNKISFLKFPLFIAGVLLCIVWFVMYRNEILANLEAIGFNWIPILFGALLVAISSFAIVKWQTRKGKPPAIV